VDDILFIEQYCTLGWYMSEVQMLYLEVHFREEAITFDWIPFVNDFFADYAKVEKHQAKVQQRQTKTPQMLASRNILDRATNDLNRHWKGEETIERRHRDTWFKNCRKSMDYAYMNTFLERVARSHAKTGKEVDIVAAKQLVADTRSRFNNVLARIREWRIERNEFIIWNCASKHDISWC
jgi:hypothetical protein